MVTTVKVPEAFIPLFELAEKHVGEYFQQRKMLPEKGSIEIFGSRYILLRGAAISVEFFQLARRLFGEDQQQEADLFAASFLYELAHSIGRADARLFHKKMNLTDPIAKLSAGPVHFSHSGWAFVDIMEESSPTPDENYFLSYTHPYSFESDAWLEAGLQTSHPVCVMNSGYSSGWCQESFALPLEARELTCRALGHDECRFVMAPPDRIEQRIADHLQLHPEISGVEQSLQFSHKMQQQNAIGQVEKSNYLKEVLGKRLFTYARNLEGAQRNLARKIQLLNDEVDLRKEYENRLQESEKRWRQLADVSFDSILVCQDGVVIEANKASALMFGFEESELKTQELGNLIGAENWSRLLALLETGTKHVIEIEASFKDQIHFLEIHAHFSKDVQDKVIILAIRDISERITAMHRLQRIANYDALTGLANRTMFERMVNRDLIDGTFENKHALLFMDLDGFKSVNDNLGHTAGDLLLYEVAERCSAVIRASDLIARIGDDEFMIWVRNIQHEDEAGKVAMQVLNEMRAPFNIHKKSISTTFSIGIAIYPKDGTDFTVLASHSDHAMYQAKSAGKNTFRYFE